MGECYLLRQIVNGWVLTVDLQDTYYPTFEKAYEILSIAHKNVEGRKA